MLKYSLEENQLITRQNNYLARTHAKEGYDKTKFIKRLVGKGILVIKTDAVAALNAIENLARIKRHKYAKEPYSG